MRRFVPLALVLAAAAPAVAQFQLVFPTLPHAANNNFPFNQGPGTTMHQVYASSLFSGPSGGQPVTITRVSFAPTDATTYSGDIVLRLGYTNAIPGATPAAGGLQIPDVGGGGVPNATGPMQDFFSQTGVSFTPVAPSPSDFQFSLDGNFTYDPAQGNLLMEIYLTNITSGFTISRCAGSAEASRAYFRHGATGSALNTQAHRTEFVFDVAQTTCYPDCNGDGALNLSDFGCFQTAFALGQPYADCNGDGVRNLSDFGCFQTQFALGCP
jgi:hypothetical protein